MNISHALAKRMGASAEIIYLQKNSITYNSYPDIFIGLHDFLDASQGEFLILELLQITARHLLDLLSDLTQFIIHELQVRDVFFVILYKHRERYVK